jgi:host factor-I protein
VKIGNEPTKDKNMTEAADQEVRVARGKRAVLAGPKPAADEATPEMPAAKPAEKQAKPMLNEKNQNLQEVFLNHIRKNKTPVTVFLVNGVKLQGIVSWFDNFCVLLRRDGHSQLVYKHAISTVMPIAPITLFEGKEDGE